MFLFALQPRQLNRSLDRLSVLAEGELDGATRLAHDWEANGVEVDHSLDIT